MRRTGSHVITRVAAPSLDYKRPTKTGWVQGGATPTQRPSLVEQNMQLILNCSAQLTEPANSHLPRHLVTIQ